MVKSYQGFNPYKIADCTTNPTTNITNCTEVLRDKSWNDKQHLLVIENPISTGYSYGADKDLVSTV